MLDYFLSIDGIPGDCTERGFEGQIVVAAWSWKEEFDPTVAPPSGSPIPLRVSPLVVSKRFDRATPKLMLACASRQPLGRAVLSCVTAGGVKPTVLRVTLTNLHISSYQARGGDDPEDSSVWEDCGLAFESIELEFTELRPNGAAAGVVRGGWNVRTDQSC
jgi:type VI secretion system secreted protein Hcp